jgi:hypothetical protein
MTTTRTALTLKTSIQALAAAVALAAATMPFAAPAADAMPPRGYEIQVRERCTNADGTWTRTTGTYIPRDRYYSCTFAPHSDGYQAMEWYTSAGRTTQVCYRFSVDTAWVCQ